MSPNPEPPTPEPRDALLNAEKAAFDAAFSERRWQDATRERMAGLYSRAVAALGAAGYDIRASNAHTDETVSLALNFETLQLLATVCRKAVSQLGDSVPALVEIAAESFSALEAVQAILEGWDSESEDEGVRTAKLILLGSQMGMLSNILAQWETGQIDAAAANAWKLYRLGEGKRGRVVSWEQAFLPHAVAYCEGKEHVPLAGVVRLAKEWAGEERAAGRNPGLPGTDDGVEKGIKRMERRAVLAIPGRSPAGERGN